MSAPARALDFLTARYRESVDLVPVHDLPSPYCGVDLESWEIFFVGRKSLAVFELGSVTPEDCRLGASEHVAVHRITGEVRYLGFLGE